MSFTKILIANRGEIACRVMRTARALGYRTVAVYQRRRRRRAARGDRPTRRCASAPAPAAESYLNIDALHRRRAAQPAPMPCIPATASCRENADFAQACVDAGLVFIGPPPAAIAAMGDKAAAKRRMLAAGVPCVPGYHGADQGDARSTAEAAALGFPLLVKAVAGGGGRGMRLVRDRGELRGGDRRRAARGAHRPSATAR